MSKFIKLDISDNKLLSGLKRDVEYVPLLGNYLLIYEEDLTKFLKAKTITPEELDLLKKIRSHFKIDDFQIDGNSAFEFLDELIKKTGDGRLNERGKEIRMRARTNENSRTR